MGPINGHNLRRLERGEDVDATQQQAWQKEQARLKKYLELLVHASTCQSTMCGRVGCPALKEQLYHFSNCLKDRRDACNRCRYDTPKQ
jgi:hypothetical protein